MTSELSSLYKNKLILLWVEDPLTRTWLHHLWQDADIGLLVAGGNDAVFGAVKDAREAGHTNVFGFRDRDFIASNEAHWLVKTKNPTVFVPEAHEVENLLLDFDGLASLDANYNPNARAAGDLEARAHQHATNGIWWMAARATIADVRMLITDDFPNHPKPGTAAMASVAAAQAELERLLLHSAWGTKVYAQVPTLNASWIASRLAQHKAVLQGNLSNGSWRWTWSGKELWMNVIGYMINSPVTAAVQADFAKALADHQRANSTVAPVMTDLYTALRKRTGLEVW